MTETNAPISKPFQVRLGVAEQNLERNVKTAFDLAKSEGRRLRIVFSYKTP